MVILLASLDSCDTIAHVIYGYLTDTERIAWSNEYMDRYTTTTQTHTHKCTTDAYLRDALWFIPRYQQAGIGYELIE